MYNPYFVLIGFFFDIIVKCQKCLFAGGIALTVNTDIGFEYMNKIVGYIFNSESTDIATTTVQILIGLSIAFRIYALGKKDLRNSKQIFNKKRKESENNNTE